MTNLARESKHPALLPLAIRIAAAVLAASLCYGWALSLAHAPDPERALSRDWTNFQRAGRLLLEGRAEEIYPSSFETVRPFPYPPFFLYPCALLGRIDSTWIAYALCVGAAVAELAGALFCFRRCFPDENGRHTTVAFVAISSAPWIGALVTGQQSALYVLFAAAGACAWRRGETVRAGLWLSLLCMKPNLGLLFPVLALASRQWRVLGGFLLGLALLVVSTLPLGLSLWSDYFDASARMGQLLTSHGISIWKQQTLYAFWRWTLGEGTRLHLAEIAAAIGAFALGAPVLWLWRTRAVPRDLPRLVSIAVLFLVACNLYLFFYDGLLLLIPAVVWYTSPESYARASARRWCGGCIAAAYAWQHASSFVLQRQAPPLLGPIVAVWLAIEIFDLARLPAIAVSRPQTLSSGELLRV